MTSSSGRRTGVFSRGHRGETDLSNKPLLALGFWYGFMQVLVLTPKFLRPIKIIRCPAPGRFSHFQIVIVVARVRLYPKEG